uniref:DUF6144 family protein n=1 Tax=Acetatifactor sp. TaxID=1872090 RepID=UPI004055C605
MKNFNMPEVVSPTLEADEMERLYESIKNAVSKEEADNVVKAIPLANNSTPEERAEWVEKLSELLEMKFDTNTIKQIRQGCYCTENGKLEESANSLRELYVSLDCNIHNFIDTLNEQGAGWYIEDGYLYIKMFNCPCPMLEKTKIVSSLTWCHCTAGYGKKFFGIVFDVDVEAEIVHSMRQGFDECLVRLALPFDL